jgi:hypothetical protein
MENAAIAAGSADGMLGVVLSAMRDLADVNAAELTAAERADALLKLERTDAALTVVRSRILTAFDANRDFQLDAQRSAGAWLVNKAKVTRPEASGYRAWAKLVAGHSLIAQAMTGGILEKSRVRKICSITSKIPGEFREEAETIIVAAAAAGAELHDLVFIAAEILARTAGTPEEDDKPFKDRDLRLEVTLDGAGVLHGELSPECTAAVQAVLAGLSPRSGPDDDRSYGERMHDGLQDAMLRILGSDLVPKKQGHPVQAIVHVSLADLLALDDGSVMLQEWAARYAAQWAGQRAANAEQPGDGGAWITGSAVRGITCDAALFPIVTGTPDTGHLDDLIRLCAEIDRHLHDRTAPAERVDELMREIIGKCAAVMSGATGLAAMLRRNLLGQAGLGGPSLPLDVGDRDDIPWWIRRAVHTRDQTCRWPGGCGQRASATQPHHVVHRADHGVTKVENLYDLCWFHHHVMIHRRGWTARVRGDGTLEARSPDGRVITKQTSRPPPPRPG